MLGQVFRMYWAIMVMVHWRNWLDAFKQTPFKITPVLRFTLGRRQLLQMLDNWRWLRHLPPRFLECLARGSVDRISVVVVSQLPKLRLCQTLQWVWEKESNHWIKVVLLVALHVLKHHQSLFIELRLGWLIEKGGYIQPWFYDAVLISNQVFTCRTNWFQSFCPFRQVIRSTWLLSLHKELLYLVVKRCAKIMKLCIICLCSKLTPINRTLVKTLGWVEVRGFNISGEIIEHRRIDPNSGTLVAHLLA